jgi:hypothetical protein
MSGLNRTFTHYVKSPTCQHIYSHCSNYNYILSAFLLYQWTLYYVSSNNCSFITNIIVINIIWYFHLFINICPDYILHPHMNDRRILRNIMRKRLKFAGCTGCISLSTKEMSNGGGVSEWKHNIETSMGVSGPNIYNQYVVTTY